MNKYKLAGILELIGVLLLLGSVLFLCSVLFFLPYFKELFKIFLFLPIEIQIPLILLMIGFILIGLSMCIDKRKNQ